MVGLVIELELSQLVGDNVEAFLVKLLQLAYLLELLPHVVHNHARLVGLLLLIVCLLLLVLTVDQFLEVVVSEAFHQIELVLEYYNAVVGLPIGVFGLPQYVLSHLAHFLEKGNGYFEFAIE